MLHNVNNLKLVLDHFKVEGDFISAFPYGSGHINDTYLCRRTTDGKPIDYILQRINHNVFTNPPKLMENISRVTTHLHTKLKQLPGSDPRRDALTVLPTHAGKPYHIDEQGNYWRTYIFITNAKTHDRCDNIIHARESAMAIGRFQNLLADLPGERLHEIIPFFHHTPRRFQTLEEAVKADCKSRKKSAEEAIEFCMARRELAYAIIRLLENGSIPERITHNDAKFNNVMIDDFTGKAVCVIDLDTVMPGCSLYDFGDMVRTIARKGEEDDRNLSGVEMSIETFEALVKGYMEGAGEFLCRAEKENLPLSGQVITFTIGIRFLTDYLMGDVYFKTHRPEQNLDRAMVQFQMVRSMEQQIDAMHEIVHRNL